MTTATPSSSSHFQSTVLGTAVCGGPHTLRVRCGSIHKQGSRQGSTCVPASAGDVRGVSRTVNSPVDPNTHPVLSRRQLSASIAPSVSPDRCSERSPESAWPKRTSRVDSLTSSWISKKRSPRFHACRPPCRLQRTPKATHEPGVGRPSGTATSWRSARSGSSVLRKPGKVAAVPKVIETKQRYQRALQVGVLRRKAVLERAKRVVTAQSAKIASAPGPPTARNPLSSHCCLHCDLETGYPAEWWPLIRPLCQWSWARIGRQSSLPGE